MTNCFWAAGLAPVVSSWLLLVQSWRLNLDILCAHERGHPAVGWGSRRNRSFRLQKSKQTEKLLHCFLLGTWDKKCCILLSLFASAIAITKSAWATVFLSTNIFSIMWRCANILPRKTSGTLERTLSLEASREKSSETGASAGSWSSISSLLRSSSIPTVSLECSSPPYMWSCIRLQSTCVIREILPAACSIPMSMARRSPRWAILISVDKSWTTTPGSWLLNNISSSRAHKEKEGLSSLSGVDGSLLFMGRGICFSPYNDVLPNARRKYKRETKREEITFLSKKIDEEKRES